MADFSKLRAGLKKDATKRPTSDFNDPVNTNIPTEDKNTVAGQIDTKEKVLVKSMQELDPTADDFLLQVGILVQDNIKKGNLITWAINKAVKADAPPEHIALLAVKEISLLTDDTIVYKMLAERYRQKYGIELIEKHPYEIRTCKDN